jgi:hypothetical protein
MDLIAQLSSQLGIPADAAKAVAGAAFSGAEDALPEEHSTALHTKIPELTSWKSAAASLLAGGAAAPAAAAQASPAASGIGGLLGSSAMSSLAGALGGESAQQQLAVVGALSKLGIDPSKAALIGPLVLDFAKERLDEATLKQLVSALPMLTGEGGAAGAAAGALGKIGSFF